MDELCDTYKVFRKFGLNMCGFGPKISFINDKIGVCIPFNTSNFGFLNRNFQFDNIGDLEKFIKKYSLYKSKSKTGLEVTFDDYNKDNPNVTYILEAEEKRRQTILEKNNKLLKDSLEDFKKYISDVQDERMARIKEHDDLVNMTNIKIEDYKKLLYKYYNKEYDEVSADKISNKEKFNNKYEELLEKIDKIVDFTDKDFDSINELYGKLIENFKQFELDEDFFLLQYDYSFFKNKSDVVGKMYEYIKEELKSDLRDYEKLKRNLDDIKTTNTIVNDKNKFIRSKINKIEYKYAEFDSSEYFNFTNYINKKEYKHLEDVNSLDNNNMNKSLKDLIVKPKVIPEIVLLFSPLRNLLLDVLNGEVVDKTNYFPLYNELVEKSELASNIILFQKYFKKIDLSSFNAFYDSSVAVADIIRKSKCVGVTNDNYRCWSYDVSGKYCLATSRILKDVDQDIYDINLKKNSNVYYSNAKIIYNPSDLYSLKIEKNDELIIINDHGSQEIKDSYSITDYDYNYKKKNIDGKNIDVAVSVIKTRQYDYVKVEM